MKKSNFEFKVLVGKQKQNPATEYAYDGKLFIESRKDSKFNLEIYNPLWNRVETVVSVDGLSVIDGKTATEKTRGYIINGLSKGIIEGWRTSLDNVSEFVFSSKEKSLSENTGYGTTNVGVISCRIYNEKIQYSYPIWKNSNFQYGSDTTGNSGIFEFQTITSNSSTPASIKSRKFTQDATLDFMSSNISCEKLSESVDFDMGTSWGNEVDSKVIKVEFERGVLLEEFNIYYGSKDMLQRLGIDIEKEYKINRYPNGFSDGFCKIPNKK